MKTVEKDREDTQRIIIDWSKWLLGSVIASVIWEPDSGISLSAESFTNTTATVFVTGGTEDAEYWLKCTITTADSIRRVESRSIRIRVVRKVA